MADWQWRAGMRVTAGRLTEGPSPTVITTGLTAASGFTVNSFVARKSGRLVTIDAEVITTNAISQSSGNLSDTAIATLPDGWMPLSTVNGIFGNGLMDGEYTISTGGTITLRSALANIGASTGLRISNVYIYAREGESV